jgi:BexC/CtrB/KpsE family polysaccharide export inner-membrane protein
MTDNRLKYLGPLSASGASTRMKAPLLKRAPWPFIVIVLIPTLLAAIYYLFIAAPRYVSEAQFIVRAPSGGSQPSSLGVALQGVGLASTQTDAFAVHEYIRSRDSLTELRKRNDIEKMLGQRGSDILTSYPRPWERRSSEALFSAFKRFVVVGYDSTTGISKLRVEAFSARDANRLAEGLLSGGEQLVNRLNERASRDAVANALRARESASAAANESRRKLLAVHTQGQFLAPQINARESSELIGGLRASVAQLRAERAQLAQDAPTSPQLPMLDGRIAAYERQIEAERGSLAGGSASLASKASTYEALVLERELADKEFAMASAVVISAEQDAQKQKLYLDRVVSPSLPDEPEEPKRWLAILTVFATLFGLYGIGWLVWAGVREHRHG